MTAPSIREAVARAICKTRGIDPDDSLPEEIRDGRPPWPFWQVFTREADAALAVALPILQSHFEGVVHSVAHDSLEGSTHREYFNKGVEAAAAAIRADEGPK